MPEIDVKVTLANERTFLAWLHMAVALGTVAAALLSFGAQDANAQDTSASKPKRTGLTTIAGLILLPVAALYAIYAAVLFYGRLQVIRKREAPKQVVIVPIIMGVILIMSLIGIMWIHV